MDYTLDYISTGLIPTQQTEYVKNINSLSSISNSDYDEKIKDVAKKFEASFLAEMLKFADIIKPREGISGGGAGEEAFSSFLVNEYAQEMSKHYNIGLAERIYSTLQNRLK